MLSIHRDLNKPTFRESFLAILNKSFNALVSPAEAV